MQSHKSVLASAFAALVFTSASCSTEPTGVTVRPIEARAATPWQPGKMLTYDETLEQISERIPGFGGLHETESGVAVFLQHPGRDSAAAEPVIRAVLRASRASRLNQLAGLTDAPMSFKKGEYGFSQLMRWKRSFYNHRIPAGTVFLEIDKYENRLRVSTSRESARAGWASIASKEGIPDAAIVFSEVGVPTPTTDLHSAISPTAGGAKINMVYNGADFGFCSLGANAALWSVSGGKYFVTASHCSAKMWGIDSGTMNWYQPYPTQIGAGETSDAAPWANGSLDYYGNPRSCYSGALCRLSDANLVPYTNGSAWQLGRVAIANAVTSPTAPTVAAFQQYGAPPCGWFCPATAQYRTGQTTGTRTGSSNRYSADYFPDSAGYAAVGVIIGNNWVILGQTIVPNMVQQGGDSGAPMFHYEQADTNNTTPIFDGISHARLGTGEVVYSPVGNLAWELGNSPYDIYFY